jgi:hypothetical protein
MRICLGRRQNLRAIGQSPEAELHTTEDGATVFRLPSEHCAWWEADGSFELVFDENIKK